MHTLINFAKLTFTLLLISSCMFEKNSVKVSLGQKKNSEALPSISNVSIINNQLVVNGINLDSVQSIKIQKNSPAFNETFNIESKSPTQVIANGLRNINITTGELFDLVLGNAYGAATFQVSFTLPNGSVTAAHLNNMGATSGQILKYNGTAWAPANISSSQTYVGVWNATANVPDLTAPSATAGEYYIVDTAGTFNGVTYAIGDWIISNGSNWDKVSNVTGVSSFKGRQGNVTPQSGDYTWAQITKTGSKLEDVADVDVTGRADGKVLKWNAATSKWVTANDEEGSGTPNAGTVTNNEVSATADIAQSKIHNLVSDLAGKEPAITAAATTKYFRGDKTFVTLDTNVVPENINLYFTNARALGIPLTGLNTALTGSIVVSDTLIQALGKIQNQISSKLDTGTFIDWSASGLQTIDPSRLNIGAGSASKALVSNPSGFIVASATSSTELGYVSGVTSSIQTQLNAKQNTIDKTTVQAVSTVKIYGANTTNYVELSVPTLTANTTYKFPAADGTNGQILTTDHSGNLSWTTPSGSALTDSTVTYAKLNLADGDIPQAKINGLVTALSGKEPAITAGTSAQYLKGDKTLGTFASDVLATLLTGFSTATNAAVAATDSVLDAFGKLQAQVASLQSLKLDKTGGTLTVGTINGVPVPVNADDVANKSYVDQEANNGVPKVSVGVVMRYVASQATSVPLHDSTSCDASEAYFDYSQDSSSLGFCMEKTARTAANWQDAKQACTAAGKRLPESNEWMIFCSNGVSLGMTYDSSATEWTGNSRLTVDNFYFSTIGLSYGGTQCAEAAFQELSATSGKVKKFRCIN